MAKTTDNPRKIINAIFNEKQEKFLLDNQEEIEQRYNMTRDIHKSDFSSYAKEQFRKLGVPLFSSRQEFNDKFSKLSRRETNELWKLYNLEFKAVISGMEEEKRVKTFFQSYISAGHTLGDTRISLRLNAINRARKKGLKVDDIYQSIGKDTIQKILAYYKDKEMKTNEQINEVVEGLDRIISAFGISMKDDTKPERHYSKREKRLFNEDELANYYESMDVLDVMTESRYSNPYIKTLKTIIKHKSLEERKNAGLVNYGDDNVYIKGKILDSFTAKEFVYEELDKKSSSLRYNKQGEPYMRFIRKDVVKEWIENKKKNE